MDLDARGILARQTHELVGDMLGARRALGASEGQTARRGVETGEHGSHQEAGDRRQETGGSRWTAPLPEMLVVAASDSMHSGLLVSTC